MLTIGDQLPQTTFKSLTNSGMQDISTDFFNDKKALIFAVPGAFTNTCTTTHLPGYLKNAAQFKAKGFDVIACLSVNDAFVMKAWADACGVKDEILMLADGSAHFTKAAGFELDLTAAGFGVRSRRYAMIVEKGKITGISLEEGGVCDISAAEKILAAL